jgi:hypothetical protein
VRITAHTWVESGECAPWDLASESGPWPDCRYWSRVLLALDALLDKDLRVVMTRNVDGRLPLSGPDVLGLVFSDEFGLEPTWAHQAGLVVKTMGAARRPLSVRLRTRQDLAYLPLTVSQELRVQGKRARHKVRAVRARGLSRPHLLDVPLGTHLLEDVPVVPFADRTVDVGFAGSLGNSELEPGRRFPSQKLRARRAVFAALEQLGREAPEVRVSTHQLLSFHWAHDHTATYSEMLAGTRIALCPRGSVWETYRFWEALASGCVVVGERLPRTEVYAGAPVVVIDDWSRLTAVVRDLLKDEAGLAERADLSRRFWQERAAPPAVAARIAAALP